jgi:hypothetical protein
MMDAIEAPNNKICFLHVSGDILMMNMDTFEVNEVFHPREAVVGRKLDADSHRLLRSAGDIFVGHLEGIIDRTPK